MKNCEANAMHEVAWWPSVIAFGCRQGAAETLPADNDALHRFSGWHTLRTQIRLCWLQKVLKEVR